MSLPFKDYIEENDALGLPQEYKGIKFYPLKLITDRDVYNKLDILYHNNLLEQETFLKKMSLLKYFLFINQVYSDDVSEILKDILESTCKCNISFYFSNDYNEEKYPYEVFTYGILKNEEHIRRLRFYIRFDYKGKDPIYIADFSFNVIKKILLFQNGLPSDNFRVSSKTLDEKLKKDRQKKLKSQNGATFAEQIIILHLMSHTPMDMIKNYTYKQFRMCIDRIQKIKEYDTFKALESAGFISFKNKKHSIDDWFVSIKHKGLLDDLLLDADDTKKNIESVNG